MENETKQPENLETQNIQPKKEGSAGPLIGSILIILIFIAGGIYFFSNITKDIDNEYEAHEEFESNDLRDIEAELEAEIFSDIDFEMSEIEAEFEAELLENN